MASEYTKPKAGEHIIGYAYPGSDTARALHHELNGCYVVWLVGQMHAHPNYASCVAQVSALGTRPGRWSADHPWNQRFYPEHNLNLEARAWHQRLLAEEAQRVAAAERTQAVVDAGGSVTVDMVVTPMRTVVMETHRDASGNCLDMRNAGEIWWNRR